MRLRKERLFRSRPVVRREHVPAQKSDLRAAPAPRASATRILHAGPSVHVELRRWIRDWRVTVCDQRSRGPVPAVQRWTWAHGEPGRVQGIGLQDRLGAVPGLEIFRRSAQRGRRDQVRKLLLDWMRG